MILISIGGIYMNKGKKIFSIGQIIMVIGSLLYLLDLVFVESARFSTIIARKFGAALPQLLSSVAVDVLAVIYAVAIVLMLIGWILKRKEKKAE